MQRLLILLFLFCVRSVHGQEVYRNFALFAYNSYELTPESRSMIDGMLLEIGDNKIVKVELYGHTDSEGDAEANKVLSQNRVNAVKDYLLTKGISRDVFVTDHFGEEKPAYPNATENGMQKNRRVEIVFSYETVKQEVISPAVDRLIPISPPVPPAKTLPLIGAKQVFRENTKHEITITGAQGTILIFSKNCFVDATGNSVTGEIEIELAEVYTRDEMIRHNLTTTANKRMLESAGMVFVTVHNDAGMVYLDPKLPYSIEFPSANPLPGMELFYGDTTSGVLDWVPKTTRFVTKGGDVDVVAQQTLNKYLFTSAKLGWINCDRFIKDFRVTRMLVETNDTAGVSFCIVFKDFNSVMGRDMSTEEIVFTNVPIGQTATIIAFRKTETGAFYASQEVIITDYMRQSIVMTELSEEAFQLQIQEFR